MPRSKLAPLVLIIAVLLAAFAGSPSSRVSAAGQTCAYVFGTIEGRTVTTPAVVVVVPDSSVAIDPVRVHVDETRQEILGYTLKVPGVDTEVPGQRVYVPGISRELVPALKLTIADLNIQHKTCVSFGVTTPAVPIYIPESRLQVPGAAVEVPAVYLNILGIKKTVGGKVITLDGQTIVVPGLTAVVPPISFETPNESITVDINGTLSTAHHMAPR